MRLCSSLARVGLASLVGALATFGASRAEAADPCDPAALTCSTGTAKLGARIKSRLPTQIDSGVMGTGPVKIRTRFTIDPVGGEPLVALDMTRGAMVEATWSEKGYIDVRPVAEQGTQGTMSVRYTLTPSLEGSIYGIGVDYSAAQLVAKLPGGKLAYDAKGATVFQPWGFAGANVTIAAPPLDQSTIFTLPFSQLGVSSGVAEGTLSIQAAANPTFRYVTKDVRLDAASVTRADGTARIAVGDADFVDLTAMVAGELSLAGNLDVRPVVKVDSVDGYPTFGLVKLAFTAVSTSMAGGPMPVAFENTEIHVPLPNVKVPSASVDMGTVKAGHTSKRTVTIDSTGELGGRVTFESSDPQFTVPAGEVRVGAKGKHALEVTFAPTSDGAAAATITVRSNDPDSPVQTFRVAANGASLDPAGGDDDDGESGGGKSRRSGGVKELEPPPSEDGCACATVGAGSFGGHAALAIGLGLAAVLRRRRSR